MIKIDDIKKITELVYTSGRLKNTRPLSLMLVAGAGRGKTEIITSFKGKNIITVTDLSYMGLIKIMEENPKIKHLIVPDFIKLTNKKGSTSANLISFLNNFLEDGINQIKLYNMDKDFKGKRGAMVTATTRASFSQHKKEWENTGFLSRLIVVSYNYSDKTMQEIQEFIACEGDKKKEYETIKSSEVDIKFNKEINKKLIPYCRGDLRKQKQLQTLCKANALLEGRKSVAEKDFEEVMKLRKFINYNFKEI